MIRLLILDDDPENWTQIGPSLGEDLLCLEVASHEQDVLARLGQGQYDLLLIEMLVPDTDGLALLRTIRAQAQWRYLPVILRSPLAMAADVRAGLEAGASFYLTQDLDEAVLRLLMKAVIQQARERAALVESEVRHDALLGMLGIGMWRFRTLQEANQLATALSRLCADGPGMLLALSELTVNAIEHGNLGISYDEKNTLRRAGVWEQEVERRLLDPQLGRRYATLSLTRQPGRLLITITDEGKGFDWVPYLALSAERAGDLNGRGIAMAHLLSSARIRYSGSGNRVEIECSAA